MQVTTSWEEKGIEKERRSLVSILLNQKFEQLPDSLNDRISSLSLDQLSALARCL
jgi:Domain of unknown function (DUF4351)